MKILFVIDQYDDKQNSMAASAHNFVDELTRRGHTVTLLSTGKEAPNKVILDTRPYPKILKKYFEKEHLELAKIDKRSIRRAIKGHDLVFFYYPFKLAKAGLEICEELEIPAVATFAIKPEEVLDDIGLGKAKFINKIIYNKFASFYNNFSNISCKSEEIKKKLENYGYTSNIHVIPDGIGNQFHYKRIDKPERFRERIMITMSGRFTNKNDQETLARAIKLSKYCKYIHLILAGSGPEQNKLEDLLNKLHIQYTMEHFENNDLRDILSYTDIYVHSSINENENLSALKAVAMGNVPIIAKGNDKETDASGFALDDRSLFQIGDEQELASKIDYWIEHQTELRKMQLEYSKVADKYRISDCTNLLEKMFSDALKEKAKENYMQTVHQTAKQDTEMKENAQKPLKSRTIKK